MPESCVSFKEAIDDLCMEYAGKLDATTFHALHASQEEDERLRKAYFLILKRLRSLQRLAIGKPEMLSAREYGDA